MDKHILAAIVVPNPSPSAQNGVHILLRGGEYRLYAVTPKQRAPAADAQPLASVRLFVNGFDAPHPRTIATLLGASRRRFPLYAQGYGQTEIGLVTGRLYTRARAGHADSRCVGLPRPAAAARSATSTSPARCRRCSPWPPVDPSR